MFHRSTVEAFGYVNVHKANMAARRTPHVNRFDENASNEMAASEHESGAWTSQKPSHLDHQLSPPAWKHTLCNPDLGVSRGLTNGIQSATTFRSGSDCSEHLKHYQKCNVGVRKTGTSRRAWELFLLILRSKGHACYSTHTVQLLRVYIWNGLVQRSLQNAHVLTYSRF